MQMGHGGGIAIPTWSEEKLCRNRPIYVETVFVKLYVVHILPLITSHFSSGVSFKDQTTYQYFF